MDQTKQWRGTAFGFLLALGIASMMTEAHTPASNAPQMSLMPSVVATPPASDLTPPSNRSPLAAESAVPKSETAISPDFTAMVQRTADPEQPQQPVQGNEATAPPQPIAQSQVDDAAPTPTTCDGPYPCQLATIIDPSDWNDIFAALAFAMQSETTSKVGWKVKKTGHHGYVARQEVEADGCVKFQVVSFIGGEMGARDVTSCRTSDSSFEVK